VAVARVGFGFQSRSVAGCVVQDGRSAGIGDQPGSWWPVGAVAHPHPRTPVRGLYMAGWGQRCCKKYTHVYSLCDRGFANASRQTRSQGAAIRLHKRMACQACWRPCPLHPVLPSSGPRWMPKKRVVNATQPGSSCKGYNSSCRSLPSLTTHFLWQPLSCDVVEDDRCTRVEVK
jgi:hypothetical protein